MKSAMFKAAVSGVLAIAASAALADGVKKESAKDAKIDGATMGECHGMNSCKGQGACGGKGHSCAGKNSCKGKGWLQLSKADCDAKKGNFVEEKKAEG